MDEEKQQYSFEEVLNKLKSYCAYQERSIKEVQQKAKEYELAEKRMEELLDSLEKEDFLNEERFAKVYARSKFNSNHWGRFKIIEGLKSKGIDKALIDKALKEIDNREFRNKIKYLLNKRVVKKYNYNKNVRFLLSKGYSMSEIKEVKF